MVSGVVLVVSTAGSRQSGFASSLMVMEPPALIPFAACGPSDNACGAIDRSAPITTRRSKDSPDRRASVVHASITALPSAAKISTSWTDYNQSVFRLLLG